ncbi:MAG: [Fe-Fe] hydrogenase large subunit C-terminal domain-containing protein [Patescibacteria group bacterium]
MRKIKIKIDNQKIVCSLGQTIMQVAKNNGIDIPSLCNHPDFPTKANCRICLIEINGQAKLAPSCHVKAEDGMEIKTDTERVKKARDLNIELIFAEHIEKCPTCVWRVNCQLLNLAEKYKIEITRFKDRKKGRKIYKFANAIEIDGSQCIDCRNCLDACSLAQKINYLKLIGKGAEQEVSPVNTKKVDCIYCGQCAVHCPVGSAQEQTHWEMVEKALKDKNKIVIAQFDPFTQVSIGEEFGLPYGKISSGQVVAGLRELGFNYVFNVNFGTDITAIVEAGELIKRLSKNKKLSGANLPMFTSHCPAWVKYVEFYHPEFIPNLTTAKSPHIYNGCIIKTYWAELLKIDPKKIIVASIMPCTAKKFEASRAELKINNNWPVDYVLTIRELAWLFKKNRIEFGKLKNSLADNLFKDYSGATVVHNANGGVMESVLRAMQDSLGVNKKVGFCLNSLNFKNAKGLVGVKEAKIKITDKILRMAIVNGIGNIGPILDKAYFSPLTKGGGGISLIEVMACLGGCSGGGGQSFPTTQAIIQERTKAMDKLNKNLKIRQTNKISETKQFFDWLKTKPTLEHKILHSVYKKRKKESLAGIISKCNFA